MKAKREFLTELNTEELKERLKLARFSLEWYEAKVVEYKSLIEDLEGRGLDASSQG